MNVTKYIYSTTVLLYDININLRPSFVLLHYIYLTALQTLLIQSFTHKTHEEFLTVLLSRVVILWDFDGAITASENITGSCFTEFKWISVRMFLKEMKAEGLLMVEQTLKVETFCYWKVVEKVSS